MPTGSSTAQTPRGIDIHAHYLPRRALEAFDAGRAWHGIAPPRSTGEGSERRLPLELPWPDPRAPIDARLAAMDTAGVAVQVLSLTPRMYRYDLPAEPATALAVDVNDEIAAVVARHPKRFRGFAQLPLQDPALAAAELERTVTIHGFAGAAVGSHVDGKDWDDPSLWPVLAACERLGALLFVHPRYEAVHPRLGRRHLANLIGNPLETTIAVAAFVLGGVLERFPGLRVCFAHAGGYAPAGIGRIGHGFRVRAETSAESSVDPREALRALYFDSIAHGEEHLRCLVGLVGADHVLLGSDYPADMGDPSPVASVRDCPGLDSREQDLILEENFLRLTQSCGAPRHVRVGEAASAGGDTG